MAGLLLAALAGGLLATAPEAALCEAGLVFTAALAWAAASDAPPDGPLVGIKGLLPEDLGACGDASGVRADPWGLPDKPDGKGVASSCSGI